MVPMTPTMETISVVCLTEDQEDGDLILDLMVMESIRWVILWCYFFQVHLIARREPEENGKNGKCLSSNYNKTVKGVNVWFYNISFFSKR